MKSIKTVLSSGDVEYRNEDGKLHRTDGPAIEWGSGTKEWWVNGKCHRLYGPAIENSDGTKEWYYINGKNLTKEEFDEKLGLDKSSSSWANLDTLDTLETGHLKVFHSGPIFKFNDTPPKQKDTELSIDEKQLLLKALNESDLNDTIKFKVISKFL